MAHGCSALACIVRATPVSGAPASRLHGCPQALEAGKRPALSLGSLGRPVGALRPSCPSLAGLGPKTGPVQGLKQPGGHGAGGHRLPARSNCRPVLLPRPWVELLPPAAAAGAGRRRRARPLGWLAWAGTR